MKKFTRRWWKDRGEAAEPWRKCTESTKWSEGRQRGETWRNHSNDIQMPTTKDWKTLPTDPSGTGEAKPRLPPSVRGWARRQKASMREMIVSGRGRRNKKQRLGWAINGRQRKGRTSPATCWRRHSLSSWPTAPSNAKEDPKATGTSTKKIQKRDSTTEKEQAKTATNVGTYQHGEAYLKPEASQKNANKGRKTKLSNNSNRITLATSH